MDPEQAARLQQQVRARQELTKTQQEELARERLKTDRAEKEQFERNNRHYIEFVTNYMANKGVTFKSYYRRDPDKYNTQTEPQDDGNFSLEGNLETINGITRSGRYHSTGKSRFDIIYNAETGSTSAVMGPSDESNSFFQGAHWFNSTAFHEEKIRELIEFQIRQCGATTVSLDWQSARHFDPERIRQFMRIASEYPVKIDLGPNAKTAMESMNPREALPRHTPGTNTLDTLPVAMGNLSGEFYKAQKASIDRFNALVAPEVYKGQKGVEYNHAAMDLNGAKLDAAARTQVETRFGDSAQITNAKILSEKVKEVEDRIDSLDKRSKSTVNLIKKLGEDVEELKAQLKLAGSPEEIAAIKTKFERTMTRRDELIAALRSQPDDITEQKQLCDRLIAKLPAALLDANPEVKKKVEELKTKNNGILNNVDKAANEIQNRFNPPPANNPTLIDVTLDKGTLGPQMNKLAEQRTEELKRIALRSR